MKPAPAPPPPNRAAMPPKPPPPPPPPKPGPKAQRNASGQFVAGHKLGFQPGNPGHAGYKRKVETPELLKELGEEYLEWCADNPLLVKKTQLVGKTKVDYTVEETRLPTIQGFCQFVGFTHKAFTYNYVNNAEFGEAADSVRESIVAAQIELGAARVTDPAMTGRVAGIAERVEMAMAQVPLVKPPQPKDVPNVVHPDDPAPFAPDRLLFTQRQIEAGVAYPIKTVSDT